MFDNLFILKEKHPKTNENLGHKPDLIFPKHQEIEDHFQDSKILGSFYNIFMYFRKPFLMISDILTIVLRIKNWISSPIPFNSIGEKGKQNRIAIKCNIPKLYQSSWLKWDIEI